MKGIVFTEFLEMVEKEFGIGLLDRLIAKSNLSSGGVYTAVGTYDFFEMQNLIANLSEETGIPVQDLIYAYGRYFFQVLIRHHPNIFAMYSSAIEMLASIESHIHVQVRKLYPGAELPTFKITNKEENFLEIMYFSTRSMYMFAKALMEKTFEHYETAYKIDLELLKENGSQVKFKIYKQPHAIYS
ncbi:heme NO-binding domain-containing protein [Zunongwangia sp. F363]|uniref:Heme NO-binding domain-containing protein n=1 Tax=Autumnicola tepida TaxID=3075595 RepID=A0ABU3CBU9_9FLAO|nr:heme NO-binding domain-containing protein [Zunongwangia sp. F363]MDT0643817.1 heme NO-binding domain-containing protein [Zunongwangia sp. F363]